MGGIYDIRERRDFLGRGGVGCAWGFAGPGKLCAKHGGAGDRG
ncbi:twin-arginine translocation signal domain-containing protein [Luteithermobacter gelatinilyticus]